MAFFGIKKWFSKENGKEQEILRQEAIKKAEKVSHDLLDKQEEEQKGICQTIIDKVCQRVIFQAEANSADFYGMKTTHYPRSGL